MIPEVEDRFFSFFAYEGLGRTMQVCKRWQKMSKERWVRGEFLSDNDRALFRCAQRAKMSGATLPSGIRIPCGTGITWLVKGETIVQVQADEDD